MAEIAVKPFIMKNAVVTLGTPGDDFAAACRAALLEPETGSTDFKGLKGGQTFTFPLDSTYGLQIEYAQDWSVNTSLSWWLWTHRGQTVPFVFDPNDEDGIGHTSWAGECIIAAGAVGGTKDEVATASVTLGIVGEPTPTLVPAAPLAAAAEPAPDTE